MLGDKSRRADLCTIMKHSYLTRIKSDAIVKLGICPSNRIRQFCLASLLGKMKFPEQLAACAGNGSFPPINCVPDTVNGVKFIRDLYEMSNDTSGTTHPVFQQHDLAFITWQSVLVRDVSSKNRFPFSTPFAAWWEALHTPCFCCSLTASSFFGQMVSISVRQ